MGYDIEETFDMSPLLENALDDVVRYLEESDIQDPVCLLQDAIENINLYTEQEIFKEGRTIPDNVCNLVIEKAGSNDNIRGAIKLILQAHNEKSVISLKYAILLMENEIEYLNKRILKDVD